MGSWVVNFTRTKMPSYGHRLNSSIYTWASGLEQAMTATSGHRLCSDLPYVQPTPKDEN